MVQATKISNIDLIDRSNTAAAVLKRIDTTAEMRMDLMDAMESSLPDSSLSVDGSTGSSTGQLSSSSSSSSSPSSTKTSKKQARMIGCIAGFLLAIMGWCFRSSLERLANNNNRNGGIVGQWYCPHCRPTKTGRPELIPDYHTLDFQLESEGAPGCTPLQPEQVDFTFVTQLSDNRLWLLGEHCRRWGAHPMSVAIGGDMTQDEAVNAIRELGCSLEFVKVNVINDYNDATDFPVNRLRNLAMSKVETSHAVVLDADFLLSSKLYEHLQLHRPALAKDHKQALVIPAFELRKQCNPNVPSCHEMHLSMLPDSKEELASLLIDGEDLGFGKSLVAVFDSAHNMDGHGSTHYAEWVDQPEDKLVSIDCLTSPRYEPYLVVRHCQELPPFQAAFTGYGKNKITWIRHLIRLGWHFSQVSQGYAIHFPHTKSDSNLEWLDTRHQDIVPQADRIAASFALWLAESVPNQARTPICDKPLPAFP